MIFFLLPILYVVAQEITLVRLRGRPKVWAALPVPFAVWVVWLTVGAFREQANLWCHGHTAKVSVSCPSPSLWAWTDGEIVNRVR